MSKVKRLKNSLSKRSKGRTIYKRDGGKCQICGCRCIPEWVIKKHRTMIERSEFRVAWIDPSGMTHTVRASAIDHKLAVALGGNHEHKNLHLVCRYCNCLKSKIEQGVKKGLLKYNSIEKFLSRKLICDQ